MAQLGSHEITRELHLRSPAEELYTIYGRTCYLFPKIQNSGIAKIQLIKGDSWESQGSKRRWTFVNENCKTWVDTMESNDNEREVTFTLQEGEVPEQLYGSLKSVYTFTGNQDGNQDGKGRTKVVLKYEKRAVNADPNYYMDVIINMLKAVDDYLQATRRA